MKMETPRVAYTNTDFTQFIRTTSDPNRVAVQRVRGNRSLSNIRSLSITPEIRTVDDPKSPQLNKLRRADSYRTKPKQKPMITTSSLGLESRKKKKERRRVRSQSSPMFPPNLDVTDPNLGKTVGDFRIESIKEDVPITCERPSIIVDTEYKKSPMGGRKKSFGALKDLNLKKIIENSRPMLRRSQSQRFMQKPVITPKVKPSATDEDDSDHDPKKVVKGPLFQATTLFVPGYDFKNKQSTLPTINTRKSSTPQLPRRSSKERISIFFDKVITRQNSTPCLIKRDSKEKMKKIEQQLEEKIMETPALEDEALTIQSNDRVNEPTPSEQLNDNSINVINERKASIALKQKLFREKGTNQALDTPDTSLPSKVKQLASGYEDGTAYVKVGNLVNKTSDLSLKYNSVSVSSDYDTLLRDRCQYADVDTIFEKPCDGDNNASRSITGTESGYASLTESFNVEKDTFANSWNHNEWSHNDESSFGVITFPAQRAFTSDLCVTEL